MPLDRDMARWMCAFLNDLLRHDPEWVSDYFQFRWECTKQFASHPTMQVLADEGIYWCGPMGLLNGMCGTLPNGDGPIAMIIQDGKVVRFALKEELNAKDRDIPPT